MIEITEARNCEHADDVWQLCQELVADGTTYVFRPDAAKEEVVDYWFPQPGKTFVARLDGELVGIYLLRPVQPGRGGHIANASYFVSSRVRGQGLGKRLAEHSFDQARSMGFQAMQFNLVVETNTGAIQLWEKLGFSTIGIIPKAFDHDELGLVDARIMHREL